MKSLEEMLFQDITVLKDLIIKDQGKLISYCIYGAVEDSDGSIMHVTAFNSQNLDNLIGRIEMAKAAMIQRYNDYKNISLIPDEDPEEKTTIKTTDNQNKDKLH